MRLSNIYQLTLRNGEPHAATLGSRIRELRIRAGLTQAQLGAPLTRSFVSAVEHGRALPSLPALLLISARLGVPIGELLDHLEWTWPDIYTGIYARNGSTSPRDGR